MQNGPIQFTEENILAVINEILNTTTNELCYLPPNTNNIFQVATVYSHNEQTAGSSPYQYKDNRAFYRNTVSFTINQDGTITPNSGGGAGNVQEWRCMDFEQAKSAYFNKPEYTGFWLPTIAIIMFYFICRFIFRLLRGRI